MIKTVVKTIIFFQLLLVTIRSIVSNPCQFSVIDYVVLQDVYDSAGGDNWMWETNYTKSGIPWNFSYPLTYSMNPCTSQWQYIGCVYNLTGAPSCAVQSLAIDEIYGMIGTLPNSIGNFTAIESINVGYNLGLFGTIPASIGSLRTLTELYMKGCDFSGTIPNELTNLEQITLLDISQNSLTGTIPFPNDGNGWKKLELFSLEINQLTGTLSPQGLGRLTAMTTLNLQQNLIRGAFPQEIANLSNLTSIHMGMNMMSGTIPISALVQCSKLIYIYLYSNLFTGSLASDAFNTVNMNKLQALSLESNHLTSSLPIDFGSNLTSLQRLFLGANRFSGSLPSTLSLCSKLIELDIYSNQFSGSLPEVVLGMSSMKLFYVFDNSFTGTISSSIRNATKLVAFFANENFLSGTLPLSFFTITAITSFDVSSNLLTGTVPSTIGNWIALYTFKLAYNQFTGSMPSSISALKSVVLFECENNLFTNSFPIDTISLSMKSMNTFWIQNNFFTSGGSRIHGSSDKGGTWSNANFTSWTVVRQINASYNLFSGSLTNTFNMMKTIQLIDLTNNMFTGTVGNIFNRLPKLIQLLLGTNQFTGLLDELANPNIQKYLFTLDLTDNQLSGSLIDDIFKLPLNEFAIAKNCIRDSVIPMSICNLNQSVRTLVLDGMYSSEACVERLLGNSQSTQSSSGFNHFWKRLFPKWTSQSYQLSSSSNTIPSCLFNFSYLSTLHLSGNGLIGTLPDIISLNSSLKQLILSHNMLSGTLPITFQSKHWDTFDLSFNKLNGILSSSNMYNYSNSYLNSNCMSNDNSNSTAPSLTLSINRLSGQVPNALHDACSIDVLEGNMFTCDSLNKQGMLPEHDENRRSYECGSNSVDDSLYTFLTFAGVIALLGILCYWRLHTIPLSSMNDSSSDTDKSESTQLSQYIQWWYAMYTNDASMLSELAISFMQLRRWTVYITAIVLCIGMPIYAVLSSFYSIYQHAYAWTISLAFKSGVASTVIATLFLLAIVSFAFLFAFPIRQNYVIDKEVITSLPWWQRMKLSIRWSLVVLAIGNIIVVLTVNMVYVYASEDSGLSSETKQILVLLVSLYKIMWNHALLWLKDRMTHNITPNTAVIDENTLTENPIRSREDSEVQTNESTVSVERLKGHDAHKEVKENEVSAVTLTYLAFFNNIIAPCIAIALVSPECFYYVYNTASPVTTTYQVADCEIAGLELTCSTDDSTTMTAIYTPPFSYSFQCASTLLSSFADVFVYRYLFGGIVATTLKVCMKLLQSNTSHFFVGKEPSTMGVTSKWKANIGYCLYYVATRVQPIFARISYSKDDTEQSLFLPVGSLEMKQKKEFSVTNIEGEVMVLVTDISILLTFGVLFPPLALVGCIAICMHTAYLHFFLGRMVAIANYGSAIARVLVGMVEVEVQLVPLFVSQSLLSLPALVMMVWSLFLFDTLGDASGFLQGIWMIVFMAIFASIVQALCNGWFILCYQSFVSWNSEKRSSHVETTGTPSVEQGLALGEIRISATTVEY